MCRIFCKIGVEYVKDWNINKVWLYTRGNLQIDDVLQIVRGGWKEKCVCQDEESCGKDSFDKEGMNKKGAKHIQKMTIIMFIYSSKF